MSPCRQVLLAFDYDVNEEDAIQYAKRFDREGDGQIDYGDFCVFWEYLQKHDQQHDGFQNESNAEKDHAALVPPPVGLPPAHARTMSVNELPGSMLRNKLASKRERAGGSYKPPPVYPKEVPEHVAAARAQDFSARKVIALDLPLHTVGCMA
jgi:hypothetical protein